MIQQVRLNDATLSTYDAGQGPVVLFVHGFPLDHTMWSSQLDESALAGRVIAPDLRGFGASSPAAGTLTMGQLADDLAGLLDRCQVQEPVVMCALSMGGYVAWQFWQRYRTRLRAMILCDTRAAADSAEVAEGRRKLAARVLQEGVAASGEEMLQRLFAPANLSKRSELTARTLQTILNTSPATIAAALEGMAQRPDMTDALPQIDCPVLVVCGVADQITPLSEMQAMAGRLPQATFVPVPDAGHLAPLENPTVVNGAIRQFLQELGPPRARRV